MSRYATGKHALASCDRCGFTYKLKELKSEVVRRRRTGLLLCSECWEPDQPQLMLGERPIYDPQALRNPRPDNPQHAQARGMRVPVRPVDGTTWLGAVQLSVT